jgi:ubiquinol-cytochrome c reductase subunit 8
MEKNAGKIQLLTPLIGGTKQKGIVHYGLSPNRQNPWAGAGHDAIFNTFRRTKSQIFYWLPAMLTGYYLMSWATERYVYNGRYFRSRCSQEDTFS